VVIGFAVAALRIGGEPGAIHSQRFHLAVPARLPMSYANCYGLKLLAILGSLGRFGRRTLTSGLQQFSRYAIAY
jgi:hypothetical protein